MKQVLKEAAACLQEVSYMLPATHSQWAAELANKLRYLLQENGLIDGFRIVIDTAIPEDKIQFRDSNNNIVGKIVNLGKFQK